jgi:hypothetical protein
MATNSSSSSIPNKFFQYESKFVVGKRYETLRVKKIYVDYISMKQIPDGAWDECGTIIPDSVKPAGIYVRSKSWGFGDNHTRDDYFLDEKTGKEIMYTLEYDGSTRYREIVD